ncbi:minor tail protein [Mycobacterium phage Bongo]|uniref:Minor tail protein n=4 Tax=Bongovirus bongo TaxID=1983750 RepID=A0A514DJ13_9CAUD|nr:minor tail protein [Mycobacterium phage Bongo]AER26083.1 minor tail protein [Mycobacterium phage Bongo]AXQ52671.1 minor tail protein [Mycobacterium phage IPhane7]QDH93603.1 minor tail protein [Mycobacterium phage LilhomieP]QGJ93177.1 minor tail protein [Mycobacterium phage TyDawg]
MGGIPTGSDPSGYDIEGWDGPVVGAGLGALQARTEGAIKDMLQQRVSNNTTLKEFSDRVFEGLDATLGIVVAPIKALVEKMFPFIDFDGVLTMEELLALVQHIPLIGDFVELILGIEDGDEDDLGTFFLHLRQFFEGVNFLDPDFDPRDAAQVFVNTVVNPFVSTIQRISAAILGVIPIGLLSAETPTLLLEGEFDDPVTIVEGSGFVHDATDGATTPLGCAKAEADGTHIVMATELIKVAPGWKLAVASKVKWEDLETDGDDAIRINIIPYADEETPASGGSVMAASVQSASGDSTGTNGWGTTISGTYTVPSSGVAYVSVELHVTDDATAGSVKYDNVTLKSTEKIPQSFTKDLVEDLTTLWNGLGSLVDQLLDSLGITPVGDLLARIFDLSDEIAWIQEKARDGADDAAQALSYLADLAGDLLTNPGAVLGTIPQSLVGGLETTLNQIRDVFDGLVVTPVNSVVSAIKSWFDQWFGGGSTNAIPLSQKGAASGVAPLNSSTKLATSYLETDVANGVPKLNSSGKIPTSSLVTNTAGGVPVLDSGGKVGGGQMPDLSSTYLATGSRGAALGVAPLNNESVVPLNHLPAEVGGTGGSGDGRPYVILTLGETQDIPSDTETFLEGWEQVGSSSVTFKDGTNKQFRFNQPGWWLITGWVRWEPTLGFGVGWQSAQIYRELEGSTDEGTTWIPATYGFGTSALPADTGVGGLVINQLNTMLPVTNMESAVLGGVIILRMSPDDYFGIKVHHKDPAPLEVYGGTPYPGYDGLAGGSHLLCTYMGAA